MYDLPLTCSSSPPGLRDPRGEPDPKVQCRQQEVGGPEGRRDDHEPTGRLRHDPAPGHGGPQEGRQVQEGHAHVTRPYIN